MATPQRLESHHVAPALLKAVTVLLGLFGLLAAGALVYGLYMLPVNRLFAGVVCAGSGILLGAIVFAFLKGGEWEANLGLTIISIGLSLFLGNLVLMLVTPKAPINSAQAAIAMGAPFDTRTPWEVVRDLRREGIAAYPRSPTDYMIAQPDLRAEFEKLLPVGGVSHTQTVLCNESGTYTIFKSDQYGFNNDDSAYDAPGGLDMLIVGDSFAQGYCVPPGQDIAGQLRASGSNAVTIGNNGNGPLLELASLVEYGRELRPPVVLWLYYAGNDLYDLLTEQEVQPLRGYLEGYRQNLPQRQKDVDTLLKRIFDQAFAERLEAATTEYDQQAMAETHSLGEYAKRVVTLYELRRWLSMDRESFGGGPQDMLPLLEQTMRKADATVRGWGGKLYVGYLPDWQSLAQHTTSSREAVLSMFDRLGLPVIDFETRLRQTPDPLDYFPFRLPNHYTAEGYALLAEQIRAELK